MKKIITIFSIVATIISLFVTSSFATNEKTELNTKQFVKTLKIHINKDKFEKLEEHAIINPLKLHNIKKYGFDYAYLEPTMEKVQYNLDKTNELISFLKSYKTNDVKINSVSNDMIVMLEEMNENLDGLYRELNSQYKLDVSDSDKMENLQGIISVFNTENKLYAYDYLNRFNNRLDKIEQIYKQIKKLD